MKNSLRDAK